MQTTKIAVVISPFTGLRAAAEWVPIIAGVLAELILVLHVLQRRPVVPLWANVAAGRGARADHSLPVDGGGICRPRRGPDGQGG
jgi:hypothetical protein